MDAPVDIDLSSASDKSSTEHFAHAAEMAAPDDINLSSASDQFSTNINESPRTTDMNSSADMPVSSADSQTETEESPQASVGRTYELVEQTLLYLPMKDIYVAQRVNRDWKRVIQRSHPLQKKMWLMPRALPAHPKPIVMPAKASYVTRDEYSDTEIKVSPFLDQSAKLHYLRTAGIDTFGITTSFEGWHHQCKDETHCRMRGELRFHFSHNIAQEDSRLDTMITDPPITTVKLPWQFGYDRREIHHSRGCTFRHLLEAHQEYVKRLESKGPKTQYPQDFRKLEDLYAAVHIEVPMATCSATTSGLDSHTFKRPGNLPVVRPTHSCDWLSGLQEQD